MRRFIEEGDGGEVSGVLFSERFLGRGLLEFIEHHLDVCGEIPRDLPCYFYSRFLLFLRLPYNKGGNTVIRSIKAFWVNHSSGFVFNHVAGFTEPSDYHWCRIVWMMYLNFLFEATAFTNRWSGEQPLIHC